MHTMLASGGSWAAFGRLFDAKNKRVNVVGTHLMDHDNTATVTEQQRRWLRGHISTLRTWALRKCGELQPAAKLRTLQMHIIVFIVGLLVSAPVIYTTADYDGWFCMITTVLIAYIGTHSMCIIAAILASYFHKKSVGVDDEHDQTTLLLNDTVFSARVKRVALLCIVAGALWVAAVIYILFRCINFSTQDDDTKMIQCTLKFARLMTFRASLEAWQ